MIYHSTPYLKGNIGGAINLFMQTIPDDAWVCIRDMDTYFPVNNAGDWIEEIVEANKEYGLIGGICNRIKSKHQLYEGEFNSIAAPEYHRDKAVRSREMYGAHVLETGLKPIAGMCMIFSKKVWLEVGGFIEKSIYFDVQFTNAVVEKGYKCGVASGLYLFHAYRWGSKDPFNDLKHLER